MENVVNRYQDEVRFPTDHSSKCSRDLRLDVCRGLALWFIFLDHIPDNAFSWLTLRNYGFSDAAEVFVFISGYTCMLAYGEAQRDQGWSTTLVRALRRAWEIYVAFLVLLIAYAALVWVVGGGARYLDETNTGLFFRQPGPAIVHAILLQFAPVNTDILLTLALLHMSFPLVLWLMMWSPTATLCFSGLLYLMVQLFSWHLPAWPNGELYFNPFAWQFLFVIGCWYVHEGASRSILQSRGLLLLAIAYLLFSLVIALSWQFKGLESLIPQAVGSLIVSRLTPPNWRGPVKPLATALIRCGENSLAIYCLGVLLAFIAQAMLVDMSGSIAMQAALSLAGIAIMTAAATLLTWESQLDRRGPRLF